jgi:hypothetical protein
MRLLVLAALLVAMILGLAWISSAPPALGNTEPSAPPRHVACQTLRGAMAEADAWLAFRGRAGGQLVLPGPDEGSVELVLMVFGAPFSIHYLFRDGCLVSAWEEPVTY